MVLKATSIHTNFLSNGEQYATDDAAAASTSAQQPESAAAAPAQRPSQSRKNSLWSRKSREQPRKDVEAPQGAKDDNIILVVWDGDNDPENPMNWSIGRKWLTTALLCSMCLFIGLATAAFSTGIGPMTEEFGVSTEVGQVGMLLFNGAFSIVPLFLGPLSEFVGRNPIYLAAMRSSPFGSSRLPSPRTSRPSWSLVSSAEPSVPPVPPSSLAPSPTFGRPRTAVCPSRSSRSSPSPVPSVLPCTAATFCRRRAGDGSSGFSSLSTVPSSCSSLLCSARDAWIGHPRSSRPELRKETGDQRYRAPSELEAPSLKALLHASTTRAALLLVSEPVVFCFSLYIAYAWALIFAFFSAIPIVFQEIHGWGVGNGGLAYIGPLIACFLAFGLSFHGKYLYDRAQTRNNGVAVPEARLYYAAVGGILATIGMFIFAFTSYEHVHWIGPEIALVPLVMGIYFIFEPSRTISPTPTAPSTVPRPFRRRALCATLWPPRSHSSRRSSSTTSPYPMLVFCSRACWLSPCRCRLCSSSTAPRFVRAPSTPPLTTPRMAVPSLALVVATSRARP